MHSLSQPEIDLLSQKSGNSNKKKIELHEQFKSNKQLKRKMRKQKRFHNIKQIRKEMRNYTFCSNILGEQKSNQQFNLKKKILVFDKQTNYLMHQSQDKNKMFWKQRFECNRGKIKGQYQKSGIMPIKHRMKHKQISQLPFVYSSKYLGVEIDYQGNVKSIPTKINFINFKLNSISITLDFSHKLFLYRLYIEPYFINIAVAFFFQQQITIQQNYQIQKKIMKITLKGYLQRT